MLANDQVHRAGGTTRVNIEKPRTVNEANDVVKLEREPVPVQCLVSWHFDCVSVFMLPRHPSRVLFSCKLNQGPPQYSRHRVLSRLRRVAKANSWVARARPATRLWWLFQTYWRGPCPCHPVALLTPRLIHGHASVDHATRLLVRLHCSYEVDLFQNVNVVP